MCLKNYLRGHRQIYVRLNVQIYVGVVRVSTVEMYLYVYYGEPIAN